MTPSDILSRLHDVSQNDKGWMALCPAHPDSSRSLSIAQGRREGYILVHCFRGCDRGSILRAIGLSDEPRTFMAPAAEAPEGSPAWWKEIREAAIAKGRHQPWYDPELQEQYRRIGDLHDAAQALGPEDPAAWVMLAEADAIVHEFRLLDRVLAPGLFP